MCVDSNKRIRPYSNTLLKGSDLIMGHLLSNGHIHIGDIAEKINDSSTG